MKGNTMSNTASITFVDYYGETVVRFVDDEDQSMFYAKVVGTIKGIVNGPYGGRLVDVTTSTGVWS
jgi:hypothetical protein